ncbi:MAG TPA: universal stress protein [Caulobacteraceae bacterium]|jgi:nucleotide-binding universal stress UspA family protein
MTGATIALDLTPCAGADAVLRAGTVLGNRAEADLLGLAALRPSSAIAGDGYAVGELIAIEREAAAADLGRAKLAFLAGGDGGARREWRSSVSFGSPASWIVAESRGADLIVVSAESPKNPESAARGARAIDLVMGAGRPVLVAPTEGRPLEFGAAVLAWKETRETRRAALDALPFLRLFDRVVVLAVAQRDAAKSVEHELASVIGWLSSHAITAEARQADARHNATAELTGQIEALEADLVVAGAYGRPRVSEWVLGGVTCDYLLSPDRCVLLSH